jgi:hypothetical protein
MYFDINLRNSKPNTNSCVDTSQWSMALKDVTPSASQTLKRDEAQFEDCTPCRVVGKLQPSALLQILQLLMRPTA